jgi:hypothetical protein
LCNDIVVELYSGGKNGVSRIRLGLIISKELDECVLGFRKVILNDPDGNVVELLIENEKSN